MGGPGRHIAFTVAFEGYVPCLPSFLPAVVIGATNRRQDLDPALISRFSATVTFDLPTEDCR